MNTFGSNLRLTTFGESHGPAVGGVLDGFPAGFKIDFEDIHKRIDERKPAISAETSQRKETDMPEFLSGISSEGITLGTPIAFIVKNIDTRSKDYSEIADKYRPNHGDFTYEKKYGIRDFRGGGRSSARETVNWVVAGALAQQWLDKFDITIDSFLTAVGETTYVKELTSLLSHYPKSSQPVIPFEIKERISEEINKAKLNGDSVGGIVTCIINGVKVGIGDPVADKLQAHLANAMLSINAAKGFEYGFGMDSSLKKGSEILDVFLSDEVGNIFTKTNFSGGIQGGISNGMPIFFNVAFKPTPTIFQEILTVDIYGNPVSLKMTGRHDPCVALRAVPVVKAMAALVIADFLL